MSNELEHQEKEIKKELINHRKAVGDLANEIRGRQCFTPRPSHIKPWPDIC